LAALSDKAAEHFTRQPHQTLWWSEVTGTRLGLNCRQDLADGMPSPTQEVVHETAVDLRPGPTQKVPAVRHEVAVVLRHGPTQEVPAVSHEAAVVLRHGPTQDVPAVRHEVAVDLRHGPIKEVPAVSHEAAVVLGPSRMQLRSRYFTICDDLRFVAAPLVS